MSSQPSHSPPYTIRIFVAEGDPDGIRIVDRFNWTGKGLYFPRSKWTALRTRAECDYAGVYILFGDAPSDDGLPIVYVGESDCVGDRVSDHFNEKDFWSWGVLFVSANRGLNKAHVKQLEYLLLERAIQVARCTLENANRPSAPDLTEGETADVDAFYREILRILPLLGHRVFEPAVEVARPATPASAPSPEPPHLGRAYDPDTVIVSARKDGFEDVFLRQQCWHAIRISGGMLPKIKWIAAYQTKPVSAITHYAPVQSIEPYGDGSKYKLIFSGAAVELPRPIPLGEAASASMQGPRYTTRQRLLSARTLVDLA